MPPPCEVLLPRPPQIRVAAGWLAGWLDNCPSLAGSNSLKSQKSKVCIFFPKDDNLGFWVFWDRFWVNNNLILVYEWAIVCVKIWE